MSGVGQSVYYEKNGAFEALASGEEAPFSNLRLLVFAASVGYARNRFIEDHETNGETKSGFITGDNRLSVIVSSLAYAHHQDPEVILDTDRKMDVLTAYGAGGARILEQEVVEQPGDDLDNLITFIRKHRDEDEAEAKAGILEEIESDFGKV